MEKRQDYGTAADGFFESLNGPIAPLAQEVRAVIHSAIPQASESIKWGMPVYECNKLVCAVRPANDYIALQFYTDGTSLPDPDGLLEGTGKKMRHVKIRSMADIKKKLFTSWLKQAATPS